MHGTEQQAAVAAAAAVEGRERGGDGHLVAVAATEVLDRRRIRPEAVAAAVDETVILLQPPLPLLGVSIVMERERQQNDSLADG